MPRVRTAACLVALATGLAVPASAASESKHALIVELLELSGAGDLSGQLGNAFLEQLRPLYPGLVAEVVASEQDLSDEQREKLSAQLGDFDHFAALFAQHFDQAIDVDMIIEEVYVPLYDRNFEEQELREMVAFYGSPTGRKMIRVLPGLLQEGLAATVPRVQPELMRLVGQILAEQRHELLD